MIAIIKIINLKGILSIIVPQNILDKELNIYPILPAFIILKINKKFHNIVC